MCDLFSTRFDTLNGLVFLLHVFFACVFVVYLQTYVH